MFELINKDEVIEKLSKFAKLKQKELYVVGGVVRDAIFGAESIITDFDLCSSLSLDEIIEFAKVHNYDYTIKNKQLEVVAIICNGLVYEHARLRREEYNNGLTHNPSKVEFVDTIEEDAKRRDFTVNSVYYVRHSTSILDPLGGVDDIKHKRLRTVRSPKETLSVDPSRILRLVELVCRFNLRCEMDVMEVSKQYANNVYHLSSVRLKREIDRLTKLPKYKGEDEVGYKSRLKSMLKTLGLDIGIKF